MKGHWPLRYKIKSYGIGGKVYWRPEELTYFHFPRTCAPKKCHFVPLFFNCSTNDFELLFNENLILSSEICVQVKMSWERFCVHQKNVIGPLVHIRHVSNMSLVHFLKRKLNLTTMSPKWHSGVHDSCGPLMTHNYILYHGNGWQGLLP